MDEKQRKEALTAGYPRVEALIESEDFDPLNARLGQVYEDLEKIAKSKGGMGKGKAAKKAMKAIDLSTGLFKELLKIKYQIVENLEKQQAK